MDHGEALIKINQLCRNSIVGKWFNEHLSWKLGRENRIMFWVHCWIGGRSLRE